eukprot:1509282-Pyramimonas_sp.AAC.1
MRAATLGPSVELPMGPRSAVLGGGTHAGCASGTVGGAPYGAAKRCTGWGSRMRAAPVGPSSKLIIRPRDIVLGERDACGLRNWVFRWNSL